MNNENEDFENIRIIKGVKKIIEDNQYLGGKDSNKTTVIRIETLLKDFNIKLEVKS